MAAESLLFSSKAGPRKPTVTNGNVWLDHGTCTYLGPVGGGSRGMSTTSNDFPAIGVTICGGILKPGTPGFQPPQCFSTSGRTCSGVTSPATITVVYCGRYQR